MLKQINWVVAFLCIVITAMWGLKIALRENHHEDLLIYSAGASFALEGRSLYDREALRAAVAAQYPQDDTLQQNCGFFLAPQSVFLMLPFNGMQTGTSNQVTFSEVVFSLRITPMVAGLALAFALVMGLFGGLFPAWHAARQNILNALRG